MWSLLRLRTKMLIMLLVPLFLILSSMSIYTYLESRDILNKQIMQTASYLVESNSDRIYSNLKEKEVLVSAVARVQGEREPNQPEEIAFLKQIKGSWAGIKSAYTGYENLTCADSQGVTEREKPAGYDPRKRDWYLTATASNGVAYTEVYESSAKELTVGVVKKITRNDKIIGVAGITMDIQAIQKLVQEFKIGRTGYAMLLDAKGNFIYHPQFGMKDNIKAVENGALAETGKMLMSGKTNVQTGKLNGVDTMMAAAPVGNTGWTFVVFVPQAELLSQINILGIHSLISSVVALLILGIIIVVITVKLVRRIGAMEQLAGKIANGDLAVGSNLLNQAGGDEIGSLQRSFYHMTLSLRELITHVQSSAEQIAGASEQFRESSQQSAAAAGSIADSIATVTSGSENQVNTISEVSAVIGEMSGGIAKVTAAANEVAEVADKAALATDTGQKAIDKAVSQMDNMANAAKQAKETSFELQGSSQQIGEIVGLISSIAGQTNLLALNAAIEAARAGEQGRGFAVVAEEVRKLAEQSERAAQQITQLIQKNHQSINNVVQSIETAIANVDQGVSMVNTAGAEFSEIASFVKKVVNQIKGISTSLEQLSVGGRQIVNSVDNVEKTSQDTAGEMENVSAAVEEQSAAMEEIAASCRILTDLAEQLKKQIDRFKIK